MNFGFETLPEDKKLIFSVSGGRDSTAMTLEFWEYVNIHELKPDVLLMYEQTGFNRSSASRMVKELSEKTGWPLKIVKYQGEEKPIHILKEAFRNIPLALEQREQNPKRTTIKNLFRCCDVLKKDPYKKYIKSLEPASVIIVVGIKGHDGALHRRYRLRQIRDLNTFFRTKKDGYTYFYPLRDITDKNVARILRRFGYENLKGSGCAMCPFFLIADWDAKDPDAAIRSRKFAKLLGIEPRPTSQPPLRAFCSEVS